MGNASALPLQGARQRAVLASLLLHANEVVPLTRLIDDLWGEEPPKTAAKIVHNSISQIRKVLEPEEGPGAESLVTRPGGYMLRLEPEQLDANRFERLVEEARDALAQGAADVAAPKLRQALAMWRGAPLADLAYESFTQSEIARLEDLRLVALEHRIEADLALGRDVDLVGELEALVAQHPLRESFRGYLMRALYRAGRQADALAVYQAARQHLVDELGIEPGPALQRLERAILQQEPSLEAEARAAPAPAPAAEEAPAEPSAPAPGPTQAVRKAVTVLSVEVVPRGRQLDPEAMERISLDSFERLRRVVEGHGASAQARAGGGLTAIFGLPSVHEDDPLRAARAAADVAAAVAELNGSLDETWGLRLEARGGIATGEAVARDGTLAGPIAAVSADLARLAGEGETLADAETVRRLRGSANAVPVDEDTWRLLDVLPDATAIPRRLEAPLVGRDWELRQLTEAFDRARRDRTSYLFTVLGPAGIGKSRLAQELITRVSEDATVLVGRCLSYGEGVTFWPLAQILRQLGGTDVRATVAAAVDPDPDTEAVADRVAGAVGAGEPAGSTVEIFWATRKLFEALARERPLVVVIDDLHWAERTFLDLVEYVAEGIRDDPVILVCLARPEFLDDHRSWAGGKLNSTSIFLEPLSAAQSAQLLEQAAGIDLPEEAAARIAAAAEGNPLFLEQMLAMIREEGLPENGDQLGLPPTIQALLAARLDRLDPEERAVLERAAIVGRDFSRSSVLALLPPEWHGAVADHLDALARRELIRGERSPLAGDYGFRFRHGLVREAAYEAIPKQARAGLHERFAGHLERVDPEAVPQWEEFLAYHLERAYRYRVELAPVDDEARALGVRAAERLGNVGRSAFAQGDMAAAVSFLSRGAELLHERDVRRLELLVDLADALREQGHYERAEEVLDEVSARAGEAANRGLEARALVVRLRILVVSDATLDADLLRVEASRAIAVLEQLGDERGLGKAWELLAWAPWFACQVAEAEAALYRAIEYARLARDGRTEAQSIHLLVGAAFFGPLPVVDGVALCEEILSDFGGQPRITASTLRALAGLRAMEGRFAEARAALRRAKAILDDLQLAVPAASLSETVAIVELLADDALAAEAVLRRGLEAYERIDRTRLASNLAALLAQALLAQGRTDEAVGYIDLAERSPARDDVYAHVQWRTSRARVLPALGRLEEAERLAREAVELLEGTDVLVVRGDALLDLASVLRQSGRSREAVPLVEEARRLYERKGNVVAAERARGIADALV